MIVREIKLRSGPEVAPDTGELTRRMVQGEEEAYRMFHKAYFSRLLGYLMVVTRDEQAARDALQTTLLRIARYVKRFDSEEAFWSWLTVLARSSAADERRRSHRYTALLDRFFAQVPVMTEQQTAETQSRLQELLEHHLLTLPAEERDLLEQKYLEGQSVRQIAQNSQTSEKSIESRLVRIRQKLRGVVLSQLKHES